MGSGISQRERGGQRMRGSEREGEREWGERRGDGGNPGLHWEVTALLGQRVCEFVQ